jgi:hypothetical protein
MEFGILLIATGLVWIYLLFPSIMNCMNKK